MLNHKLLTTAALFCLLLLPGLAWSQGAIFGTVANSDLSNPTAEELTWFGFLDDTDEEIRTELNVGAGYDGLNWFDDFQNYTTETVGNPYDFIYANPSLGEMFQLSGTIPSNSFQQEDVVLSAAAVPTTPANLQANVASASEITLTWDAVAGLTYHVYRRDATNNGIYRRLDDPSGNLSNAGVAGGSYTDATSDGSSEYVYLVIAEDGTGQYSAHSLPLTVDAAGMTCNCPCQGDIDCDGAYNTVDLNLLIRIVFFNEPVVQDDSCPLRRTDFNCDGASDSVDMNVLISMLFFNGSPPCDPCAL